MNEPYTDRELRRIQREDHRSPTTLRFLATIARLQERVEEAQKLLGRVPDAVRGEGKDLHFHPSKLKRLLADIDRILSKESE